MDANNNFVSHSILNVLRFTHELTHCRNFSANHCKGLRNSKQMVNNNNFHFTQCPTFVDIYKMTYLLKDVVPLTTIARHRREMVSKWPPIIYFISHSVLHLLPFLKNTYLLMEVVWFTTISMCGEKQQVNDHQCRILIETMFCICWRL